MASRSPESYSRVEDRSEIAGESAALELAEAIREACVAELVNAFEDASISGLCTAGALEAGTGALRRVDLEKIARPAADFVRAERESLLARERSARAAALRASQAKADFLAVMSHELRTPLTAIMGYAELLQMGVPDPISAAACTQVERIEESARQLRELVEEVLSFAGLESGELEAEGASCDLCQICREAVAVAAPEAERKSLPLRLRTPPEPIHAVTDAAKLRKVLVNLLLNGVKFTPEGELALELARDEHHASFRVRDTGIGIPEDALERIFEPFDQVQEVVTRDAGGVGLGLAISQRVVRLLGGEIFVESRPRQGTTVEVRLPLGTGTRSR